MSTPRAKASPSGELDTRSTTVRFMQSVHKLVYVMDKEADRILRAGGHQSLSRFILLRILSIHNALSQDIIAGFLDITPAAVSRQIDGLVEAGLVTREVVKENRRQHRVTLTKAGKKELQDSLKLLERSFEPVLAKVSQAKRLSTIQTLEDLLAVLHLGNPSICARRQ